MVRYDVNNLKVGSVVISRGKYRKVLSVSTIKDGELYCYTYKRFDGTIAQEQSYTPVILTPEVLDKVGFWHEGLFDLRDNHIVNRWQISDGCNTIEVQFSKYTLGEEEEHSIMYSYDGVCDPIYIGDTEYLHTLQNVVGMYTNLQLDVRELVESDISQPTNPVNDFANWLAETNKITAKYLQQRTTQKQTEER